MIKNSTQKLARCLRALHRDENGADMVEYVLVIAAIALPILAVAVYFRNQIWEMVQRFWGDIQGNADVPTT